MPSNLPSKPEPRPPQGGLRFVRSQFSFGTKGFPDVLLLFFHVNPTVSYRRRNISPIVGDMELIFIRHGEPDWTGDESTLHDPPLTTRGRRQAELAAERLATDPDAPTDLVVSPALRSQETARPLATRTGLAVDTVDDLVELGMPSRAGLTEAEGMQLQDDSFNRPPAQWWDGLDGGETFAHFHSRVTVALEGALADRGIRPDPDHERLWSIDDPNRRIVIVAHGGTNAVAVGSLIGAAPAPWEWRRFTSNHASITRLRAMEFSGRFVWAMRAFNDQEHLPVEIRTRKRYLP